MMQSPPWQHMQQSQNYFARAHSNRRLPNPVELASRLEEARTSAKLLSQVVLNTSPEDLLNNDLVKEFADRCQSASRSMQMYMVAEDPAPDNDTMESIIETNEQLQTSLNQHQRAVLSARKKLGLNVQSEHNSPTVMSPALGFDSTPPVPPPNSRPAAPPQQPQEVPPPQNQSSSSISKLFSRKTPKNKEDAFQPPPGPPPPAAPPKHQLSPPTVPALAGRSEEEDPFRDPQPDVDPTPQRKSPSANELPTGEPRLAIEPYHPGFNQTPSYLNRQESAYDHTTMHGAANGPAPVAPGTRNTHDEDEDLYGSNDLYESSPKRAAPPRIP